MRTSRQAAELPAAAATAPITELGADLSPALRSIEAAYRQIQKRFPGTPDATIVVKRDQHAWGHTTVAKAWASSANNGDATHFELMISGENLRRGAVFVAATLLHEAAHARNLAAGVLDTDSNGRHNTKFRDAALEHFLTVEQNGWHGWTVTSLSDEAQQLPFVRRLVDTITKGLAKSAATAPLSMDHLAGVDLGGGGTAKPVRPVKGGTAVAPPKRGNRNNPVASCGCGHKIRASRGVLEACQPTCQVCSQPFVIEAVAA